MADHADLADEAIELRNQAAIQAARKGRAGPFAGLRPTGFCHWCSEPIAGDRIHCRPTDDSCAEDHEKHLRFQAGQGTYDGR